MTEAQIWIGAAVAGAAGEPLGLVAALYTDNATGRPAWVAVAGRDVTGRDHTAVVPLERSRFDGQVLHVPFDATRLQSAPHHEPVALISYADGDDLARHYGLIPTTPTTSRTRGAEDGDGVMVLSAERPVVGAVNVMVGRARLETFIVTEEQTFTIPVRRQEVRLVIDQLPASDHVVTETAPSEENYEVIRYAEQVLFSTQVVAVERVRMVRRVVTTGQTVTTALRSEQVELTHDTSIPGAPDREGPSRAGESLWD